MKFPTKHIRAGFFGLVIVFFFLPFVVVSCPGKGQVAVSGVQLSTGTVIKGGQLSSLTDDQRINVHPLALAALLCAVAGIVCSYLKPKFSFALCLAAGGVGIVLLILLKGQISREAAHLIANGLRVYYASGYWTAIVGFCLALAVTIIFNPFTKFKFPALRRRSGASRRR
jgi:hypothetical protein